eukprot:gene9141-16264_t
MSDDNVSIMSISDEEGPAPGPRKAMGKPPPGPPKATGKPPLGPSQATPSPSRVSPPTSKSGKGKAQPTPANGGDGGGKKSNLPQAPPPSSSKQKPSKPSKSKSKGPKPPRPEALYEEDEGDSNSGGRGIKGGLSELDNVDLEEGGKGSMAYISQRFNSRQAVTGPTSWLEVDERDIQEAAENLLKNVNHSSQGDNVLQCILKSQGSLLSSSASMGQTHVKDPLGIGTFHLASVLGDEFIESPEVTEQREALQRVTNKWHRSRHKKKEETQAPNPATANTESIDVIAMPMTVEGKLYASAVAMGLLPTEDGFNPEAYLGQLLGRPPEEDKDTELISTDILVFPFFGCFHLASSLVDLQKGMKTLGKELSERTGQLKQLIKGNFERFISCKGTIDDIFQKLQKLEADRKGVSTEKLYGAIEQTFGAVLGRSIKTDRIKSVSLLLRRFNNLFGMPARIRALAAEGELDQIVQSYHRANALIKPSSGSPRVWVSLYQEIERRVAEAYDLSRARLQDPTISADAAPEFITFMAALSVVEKLPGTLGEDPLLLYLGTMETYFMQSMQEFERQHLAEVDTLRKAYNRAASLFAPFARLPSGAPLPPSMAGYGQLRPHAPPNLLLAPADPWQASNLDPRYMPQLAYGQTGHRPGPDLGPPSMSQLALGTLREEGEGGLGEGEEEGESGTQEDEEDEEAKVDEEERIRLGLAGAQGTIERERERLRMLMLWPGPLDWSLASSSSSASHGLPAHNIPDHLLEHLHGRDDIRSALMKGEGDQLLALVALKVGAPVRGAVQGGTDATVSLAGLSGFQGDGVQGSTDLAFTPAQCLWVSHASRLTALLVDQVPQMWAIACSKKYSQVSPQLDGPVRESFKHAQAHADELLKRVMEVVKLQLFDALRLYVDCTAEHLGKIPGKLLEAEDWQPCSRGREWVAREDGPTTATFEGLKDEITMAMHCYRAMWIVVCEVEQPPPQYSWLGIQGAFYGTFMAFSEAVDVTAAQIDNDLSERDLQNQKKAADLARYGTAAGNLGPEIPGLGPHAADIGGGGKRSPRQVQAPPTRLLGVGQVPGQLPGSSTGAAASSGSEEGFGAALSPNKLDHVMPAMDAVLDGNRPGQLLPHAEMSFPAGDAELDGDVKLLVLLTNVGATRKKLLPPLEAQYRSIITGAGSTEGEVQCRQQFKVVNSKLKDNSVMLQSLYMTRKERTLHDCVDTYVSCTIARYVTSSHTGMDAASWGVSDGCYVLIHALSLIHMEVYVHAPTVLPAMMTALVESMLIKMAERYADLSPASLALETLLQLHLDLMFMERGVVRPFKDAKLAKEGGELLSALDTAFQSLGLMMVQVLGSSSKSSKAKPTSLASLAGVQSSDVASRLVSEAFKETVERSAERSALNTLCFSALQK